MIFPINVQATLSEMKRVAKGFGLLAGIVLLGLTAPPVLPAQAPGAEQAGLNGALLKLFAPTTAFSAQAEVRMLDRTGKETLSLTMGFAVIEGRVRVDLDMSKVRSAEIRPAQLAEFTRMGLDRVITVVRPDKKSALIIYPALKAYAEVPMTAETVTEWTTDYQVQKRRLGQEKVDGHPCERNRVTLTGKGSPPQTATVWNATDLAQFPIRIELNQPEATISLHYTEISRTRPAAKDFEPPPGTVRYESVERLVGSRIGKGAQ